jgi:hypothetical protein
MTRVAAPPTIGQADRDSQVDLLRELVTEVRALRADLAESRRRAPSLSRVDHARLARLLPAVAGALGSELFTVAELTAPAVQLVVDGLTPRQVGRLLRRAVGVSIDGLVVERVGHENHSTLWRIVEAL